MIYILKKGTKFNKVVGLTSGKFTLVSLCYTPSWYRSEYESITELIEDTLKDGDTFFVVKGIKEMVELLNKEIK